MVLVEKAVGKLFPLKKRAERKIADRRREVVKAKAEEYIVQIESHLKHRLSLGSELGVTKDWVKNDNPDRDLLNRKQKEAMEAESEAWARGFGVWHADTGPSYNTMSLDAHEFVFKTPQERARTRLACDIYNLLYYFDDLLSNDRSKELSEADKSAAQHLMLTLLLKLNGKCGALGTLDVIVANLMRSSASGQEVPPAFLGILPAMEDIISRIDQLADMAWQKKFYTLLVHHLIDANADHDGDKRLTNLDWYVKTRRDVAGMKVMLMLAELIAGGSLDRNDIDKTLPTWNGVKPSKMLECLEEYVMDIGGIWNDLISAPKEILRDKTVFNIVAVFCLNLVKKNEFEDFEHVLKQVIKVYGVGYLEKFETAYLELLEYLTDQQEKLDTATFTHLCQYVYALRRIVVGTWNWQHGRGKGRYNSNRKKQVPHHLFAEFQESETAGVA